MEDLICEFAKDDSLLESPFTFASGANGFCYESIQDLRQKTSWKDLSFILDQIIERVPAPKGEGDSEEFKLLVAQIAHDRHLGKLIIGRVQSGRVAAGDQIYLKGQNGNPKGQAIVQKITKKIGLKSQEQSSGICGDIITLYGV